MRARFLAESAEFQTPENIKKIESILRNSKSPYFSSYRKLDLNDLLDGKPGLCYFSGKDNDFSRILIFTKSFKGVGTGDKGLVSAVLYAYKYKNIFSREVSFDCIAMTSDMNPKLVRNHVIKLSKFLDSGDMLQFAYNLKKCGFYWSGSGGSADPYFVKLQQEKGNLPSDFDYDKAE